MPDESAPAPREPTRRLFFALWPDAGMREALTRAARKAVRVSGGRPVSRNNLHLTLAFLGGVSDSRIEQVTDVAHRVRMWHQGLTLQMRLERLEHWPGPRVLCALPQRSPAAAGTLAQALLEQLAAAGFSPDIKPFRPHVTVARKVMHASSLQMHAVDWRFSAFALIESRTLESGPVYSVVETYPL